MQQSARESLTLTRLFKTHSIEPSDSFIAADNVRNFQQINDKIATRRRGTINISVALDSDVQLLVRCTVSDPLVEFYYAFK